MRAAARCADLGASSRLGAEAQRLLLGFPGTVRLPGVSACEHSGAARRGGDACVACGDWRPGHRVSPVARMRCAGDALRGEPAVALRSGAAGSAWEHARGGGRSVPDPQREQRMSSLRRRASCVREVGKMDL